MNHKIALEIIEDNRQFLLYSSAMALSNLANIHKDFDDIQDEEVIMSLALNDCIVFMRFQGEYDKAIHHAEQIIERFSETRHRYYIAKLIAIIGRCQIMSQRYDEGFDSLRKSEEMCLNELPPSDTTTRLKADLLHDMAMANDLNDGDPDLSVQYLNKALALLEDSPAQIHKGICLMGLGNIRHKQSRPAEALEYYLKARDIFDEEYNFVNLGIAYGNLALCYKDLGRMDLAEENINLSHELQIRTGNHKNIATSYHNLGRFYEVKGDLEKAYINLLTSRDYAIKSGAKKVYMDCLEWLEKISIKRNDPLNAALFREEAEKAV